MQSNLYLTYQWLEEKKGYLAIISYGQPQLGDEKIEVCTLELLPSICACKQWFKRMRRERPWEIRQ